MIKFRILPVIPKEMRISKTDRETLKAILVGVFTAAVMYLAYLVAKWKPEDTHYF